MPQVLYELWVVITRPKEQNGLGCSPNEADQLLRQISPPLFNLFLDERAIYSRWRELVVRNEVSGKVGHDARLVAAMNRHGISHLLTFNHSDFKRFSSITVLTPENVLTD